MNTYVRMVYSDLAGDLANKITVEQKGRAIYYYSHSTCSYTGVTWRYETWLEIKTELKGNYYGSYHNTICEKDG